MTTPHIQITVQGTGEILECNASTPAEIVEAWINASNYIKAYEKIKDRLKMLVPAFTDDKGTFTHDGYMFRVAHIQRMTYDKAILRQVIEDEDTFDLLTVVDKPAVDNYLKEHLEELAFKSTILRNAMTPVGKPYTTIRLEKL